MVIVNVPRAKDVSCEDIDCRVDHLPVSFKSSRHCKHETQNEYYTCSTPHPRRQPASKQTPQRGILHSTADCRVSEPSNPQLGTLGSQRSTLTNCAGALLRGMNLPQSTCPENEGTQRSWRIGKEGQLPGATRDSRLGRRTLRSG